MHFVNHDHAYYIAYIYGYKGKKEKKERDKVHLKIKIKRLIKKKKNNLTKKKYTKNSM
jgi:hypothetical protein